VSRVSGDTDISVSETLFFDAGNYSAWQPVTLSAAEDEDYSEDTALIECTSPWLSTQTVTATEAENDLGKTLPFEETFETNFPMAGTIGTVDGQHGFFSRTRKPIRSSPSTPSRNRPKNSPIQMTL